MPAAKATTIDAVALLKADHRKVEELFAAFDSARKASRKEALAKEICLELTIHTLIEEEIFYPACRGAIEDDLLDEAYVEHDGAKVLLAEIENGAPDDAFFDAKVKVLSEQIKHHVKEEEQRTEGMFAQARAAGVDLEALGEEMAAKKKELQEAFKKDGLPAPITRSFAGTRIEAADPVTAAAAE
jgi:hemerythrin superfamily protein